MTFAKDYTEEYFRQLTTERRIKEKLDNGSIIIRWEQHGRNEAFDLCVYCLCGAEFLINKLLKQLPFKIKSIQVDDSRTG
jgi:phage terminase large subunit GpA-like protein